MNTDTAALGFSAIGSQPRLSIFKLLVRAGQDGLSVGDIQSRTEIAASTLAHHLKCLSDSGLIKQERRGRSTICTAEFDLVEELAAYLLAECCQEESVRT